MDKEKIRKQICESGNNVFYTYISHWNIVNRLKKLYTGIKIAQIVLTALSTGGFLASLIAGIPWLSWVGGLTSAIALGLNLYMLNFNVSDDIKSHTDAANELWDVREAYKSLMVDFNALSDDAVRAERDRLISETSRINKKYPGTDEKAFLEAQREIEKYTFDTAEADRLFKGL